MLSSCSPNIPSPSRQTLGRHTQPSSQFRHPQSLQFPPLPANPFVFDTPTFTTDDGNDSRKSPASPVSTRSLYTLAPQAAGSGFDASSLAVPRGVQSASSNVDDLSNNLSHPPDLMPSEPWALASQYAPKSAGRLPHQRESSLSSLGSAGPASPFSQNISNPQIAVSDSLGDGFSDMQMHDGSNSSFYQLAKSMTPHDSMYPGYQSLNSIEHPDMSYPLATSARRPRTDKAGLMPAPDLSNGHSNRSYPPSVASSTAGGDSPATPPFGDTGLEEDKKRKTSRFNVRDTKLPAQDPGSPEADASLHDPPKLDRTISDIYSDELYSPSFAITSASPSQMQTVASPSNDIFAQRLQAANSQHLSAGQSPASSLSRDRSPFRHDSPLAQTVNHDFSQGSSAVNDFRFDPSQQVRRPERAGPDADLLGQQIMANTEPETPKTISPKDAMLEFQGSDADSSNFPPLFPQPSSCDFGNMEQTPKPAPSFDQFGNFTRLPAHQGPQAAANNFSFVPPHMPGGMHIPQQYPFIANTRQRQDSTPKLSSESSGSSSRVTPVGLRKPNGATADGGTYTCTYHGCTLRFETPAQLQKHKREGHRQPHGLSAGPSRQPEEITPATNTLLNSQAGPHRCDRINPSTGKPCHTIFSRPYDLTRHEDTIHNARKQKVRCHLCTEEKTFSRADALTRHYRVCHPDVEFPGKYRKRGGTS